MAGRETLTEQSDQILRLHYFTPVSYANGPGARAVVWVQGCTLGCPGCFNPETHPADGGELVSLDDLLQDILDLKDTIEGVSILGGEPLQQYRSVMSLLKKIRANTHLSILLFTGYTWEEVLQMPDSQGLLSYIDVLFAGRFINSQRVARSLLGSANKTVHFLTDRYSMADIDQVPEAEVMIGVSGDITLTGIDPLAW